MFISDWWYLQSGLEQVFWTIALVFSLLLVIQLLILLLSDAEEEDESANAARRLWWLNGRSVIVFFTLIGWLGLIAAQFTENLNLLLICVVGLSLLVSIGLEFLLTDRSPAQRELLNSTGQVCESIPPNKIGMGKVYVTVRGDRQEWDAVTIGNELPSGLPVKVVEVVSERVVLVEPVHRQKKEDNRSNP